MPGFHPVRSAREHWDTFREGVREDPTLQWLSAQTTDAVKALPHTAPRWALARFPIVKWLPRYDYRWFAGDLIAGLTVGLMLVPQSIAYANVATIPVQYGLFSSYVAVILYAFIGTSKDITIGPTAVISLLTAEVIKAMADSGYSAATIAMASAFMVGVYSLGLGMLKLGIILDFFPGGILTGYTSGAALTIGVQQLPKLFGEYHVKSNNKTGTVLHDFLAALPDAHWRDILFSIASITALVSLQWAAKVWGKKNKLIWFVGVARNTFVVIIFTAISYGINKNHRDSPRLSIIKSVPSGLYKPQTPDLSLLGQVAGRSIAVFFAAVLEHVAIAKSFARRDKYQIDQNQELNSIGLVNIIGAFFGSYAVTGSFSRTAVNNASGSKSPLSGLMCAVVVIVSVCAVTPAFYYIPNSTLGAVIFMAVIQLIAGPKVWYQLWRISFWDFLGSQLAFWITLFYSVEIGIAVSVGYSLVVLLWRVARPHLRLLAEAVDDDEDCTMPPIPTGVYVDADSPVFHTKSIQPIPGVMIFRLEESFTFPNSRYIKSQLLKQVFAYTNGVTKDADDSNRLWSDDLEDRIKCMRERAGTLEHGDRLPRLRAVIFDFSAVNNLDSTGLQALFDMRSELADYAGVETFELHFVSVHQNVLRVLELADITAPIDRPEKAPPKVPRLDLDYHNGGNVGSAIVRTISQATHSRTRRTSTPGDNPMRNMDPAPLMAEGLSPIQVVNVHHTDRRSHHTSGAASDSSIQRRLAHCAFLDPSYSKILIHISIPSAVEAVRARLAAIDAAEAKANVEESGEDADDVDAKAIDAGEVPGESPPGAGQKSVGGMSDDTVVTGDDERSWVPTIGEDGVRALTDPSQQVGATGPSQPDLQNHSQQNKALDNNDF
ncbi:hypothetical protein YB2330_001412 [Saitoella coloradoensis]